MSEYKEIIFDAKTGEKTERFYTEQEIAEVTASAAYDEERRVIAEAEAQARAEAKAALLAQLGITEEQAKLLLS